MKTSAFLKSPPWYALAASLLQALLKSRQTDAKTVTEAEIAAEIQAVWANNAIENTVSPEEAAALAAEDEDLIAADQTGTAMPDEHVDLTTALLCARVAQCLATTRRAAEIARPGALTVLRVNDIADLTILGDVIRSGLFPSEIDVTSTVRPDPREKRLHHVSVYRGDGSSDTTLKLAIKRIEDAMPLRHALLVTLTDIAILPTQLREVLPAPIQIPALSREVVLFALTRTHSRTGRIDRHRLLKILPADKDLARLSRAQLFRAFREGSTLRVAVALASMATRPNPVDRLAELEGTGDLHTVARQVVSDMSAYAAGTIPWSDVPRGLLLTGAPGTGKAFAAKVIAESSGLPLIATTLGAMQSTGHLGNLLKEMVEIFDEAKRRAPCFLLIDELDSVGDRNGGDTHGKSYRQQVINELLAQIDGVSACDGVMLIGCTNHAEQIDAAVLRAGRLDMHVIVPMPGPVAIERLLHHELGRDTPVDLAVVARAAAGKTPAEIVGAIRKAKAAARTGTLPLGTNQITAALKGKIVDLGPLAWRIAVHEAGHALYAHIARMGEVMSMKIEGGGGEILLDRHTNEGKVSDYENQIAYSLAGRAAEILILGTPSAGAGGPANSDLAIATRLALQIERSTGLGRNGLVWEPDDYGGLIGHAERHSVAARLEAQAERVQVLLAPHREALLQIAGFLVDRGHLTSEEIRRLLQDVGSLQSCKPVETGSQTAHSALSA